MNHQNKKEMIFSFKGARTGNDDISFALFFLPNDAWPIVQIEIFEGGLKFGKPSPKVSSSVKQIFNCKISLRFGGK